ncbi:MAG: hypothetical protein D6766_13355 [Verrucomicrobia bacterium]|nr:MAG: hypothetical protein D6766_13355 [Verrucomicrobiota bacterium]
MQIFVNEFSVTGHWDGEPGDEAGLREWAESLRAGLRAGEVTLGTVFMHPDFFAQAAETLELLRVHARIPLLVGCSGQGLVVNGYELENLGGLVLGLYHLPEAEVRATRFDQAMIEAASGPDWWWKTTGVRPENTDGWLVFVDPFHLDGDSWLAQWNEAWPGRPMIGGLATGPKGEPRSQVYLDGEVFEDGGVAVSIGGGIRLERVVSQGCTPIGQPWTITRAEGNLIREIGNRPAYEVLADTFNSLPADEQERVRGNLLVGLVADEYKEDFRRGDFLIRNLLGGDPKSGALAVGAHPRTGQSVQFQCRDAESASEDLAALLDRARRELRHRTIFGGCLCLCNGRGRQMFQRPHHDADLVQQFLGPTGVTGFFCNGELGPIGDRNHLHGYTASLALFTSR